MLYSSTAPPNRNTELLSSSFDTTPNATVGPARAGRHASTQITTVVRGGMAPHEGRGSRGSGSKYSVWPPKTQWINGYMVERESTHTRTCAVIPSDVRRALYTFNACHQSNNKSLFNRCLCRVLRLCSILQPLGVVVRSRVRTQKRWATYGWNYQSVHDFLRQVMQ